MDRATRNETIRALAAATAAAIRIRPARSLAAISGEIRPQLAYQSPGAWRVIADEIGDGAPVSPSIDRDLPIERARNRFTGELRIAEGGE